MEIDFSHAIFTQAICATAVCTSSTIILREAPISSCYGSEPRGEENKNSEFIEYFINIMSNQGVEEERTHVKK